jgi:hypothetical protein
MEPSKVSPMPAGLLAPWTREEILDLAAYVLSAGDPGHEAFKDRGASAASGNPSGPVAGELGLKESQ